VDACEQGGQKHDFFVDVINGWPLSKMIFNPSNSHKVYLSRCVVINLFN